jgi:hypothetical protein
MDSKAIPSSALKLAMYVSHGPTNNTIFDLYSFSHIPKPLKEPSFLIPLRLGCPSLYVFCYPRSPRFGTAVALGVYNRKWTHAPLPSQIPFQGTHSRLEVM